MNYALGVKEIHDEIEIGAPEDVVALLAEYRDLPREVLLVLHLDSNFDAKAVQTSAIGNRQTCCYHSRDIWKIALSREDTDAIILVHNHPQEKIVIPSPMDVDCTKRTYIVGEAAGIPLLDHIVLGKRDWYSFMKRGNYFGKRDIYRVEWQTQTVHKKSKKNMFKKKVDRVLGKPFILE